jgi:hypothetical protein
MELLGAQGASGAALERKRTVGHAAATNHDTSDNDMPVAEPYPYIYVNADGTARELHQSERQYLETEFSPGDGAAPSIKESYAERNGWGDINGFLERSRLPGGTQVQDAPAEDPCRSMNKAEYIAWLRGKGVDVTEKSDGSFTISRNRRSRRQDP